MHLYKTGSLIAIGENLKEVTFFPTVTGTEKNEKICALDGKCNGTSKKIAFRIIYVFSINRSGLLLSYAAVI